MAHRLTSGRGKGAPGVPRPYYRLWSNAQILGWIRGFIAEHGRPPHDDDMGRGVAPAHTLVVKRFGRIHNAIEIACPGAIAAAQQAHVGYLLDLARLFHTRMGRWPVSADAGRKNHLPSLDVVERLFGHWRNYVSAASGVDQTHELLLAIEYLTPPGCPRASTAEIAAHLAESGTRQNLKRVSRACVSLMREGFVQGEHGLWRLTVSGYNKLRGERP